MPYSRAIEDQMKALRLDFKRFIGRRPPGPFSRGDFDKFEGKYHVPKSYEAKIFLGILAKNHNREWMRKNR